MTKQNNEHIKSFCNSCKKETNHKIIKSHHTEDKECVGVDDDMMKIYIDGYDYYQIIQCLGCDLISFKHISYFSESNDKPEEIDYPIKNKDNIITITIKLPVKIQTIYKETINAYNRNLILLCAVGIRMTIEGICKNKDIKGSIINGEYNTKLEGKIEGLIIEGILTKKNGNILHQHRKEGNNAAHEFKASNKNELKILIEIIQITLQNIYQIENKNNELKTLRQKKEA